MIESVLAALKTGRNIYCDEKNINPLKTARRILVTSSDELGAQIFYKKYKREFYWTEKEL